MEANDDEVPLELLVSVNDDPHMYCSSIHKPLKRAATAILLVVLLCAISLGWMAVTR